MKVFLVRHADADAEVPEGLGDEARPLTARARVAIAQHFGSLRDRIGAPSSVLMSPLVRAVQTAQILAITLGYEGPMRVHKELLPEMPVGALDKLLAERAAPGLVLVGHQPSVGSMAAHLLQVSALPRSVSPGTVIGLELSDGGPGRLLFFASPGQPVLEEIRSA